MDSNSERNVGRQTPVSESISISAPAVTQTSTIFLRSHLREGRSSAEKPEIARPAEMEISALTSVIRGFGAAGRSPDADPVAEMVQKANRK